ncbi:MAG: hypothetical protein H7334_07000 [Ferruginibacter sp.]|nr:hypothetical protein [Ferruginibacter sp.]
MPEKQLFKRATPMKIHIAAVLVGATMYFSLKKVSKADVIIFQNPTCASSL